MKKLFMLAVCYAASFSVAGQELKYCTPDAIRQAAAEYQRLYNDSLGQRRIAAQLAAMGGPETSRSSDLAWERFDRRNYEATIGMQKSLCEAELMVLRYKK